MVLEQRRRRAYGTGGLELVTGEVGAGESLVSPCAEYLVSEEGVGRIPTCHHARHRHSAKDHLA